MPRPCSRRVSDERAALAARRSAELMYDGTIPPDLRGPSALAGTPARIRRLVFENIRALRGQRRAAAEIPPATLGATARLLQQNLRAYRAAQRAVGRR